LLTGTYKVADFDITHPPVKNDLGGEELEVESDLLVVTAERAGALAVRNPYEEKEEDSHMNSFPRK
jgi:hypothetical protein